MYLIHACVMIASKRQEFNQGLGLGTKHGHLGSLCTFGSAGELVHWYIEEKEVILRCGKHLLSWYVKWPPIC